MKAFIFVPNPVGTELICLARSSMVLAGDDATEHGAWNLLCDAKGQKARENYELRSIITVTKSCNDLLVSTQKPLSVKPQ